MDDNGEYAMVERFRYVRQTEYPGKASVIFYKNGAALELNESGMPVLRSSDTRSTPYYMEAEINSPMADLEPGEGYAMDTTWEATRATSTLRNITGAGVILSPLSVAASNHSLEISGSFGVFFPGKLQAHFFDIHGGEQQILDLQPVAPQTRVDLRQEVRAPAQSVRVSVHLVDDQGIDRGSLGDARYDLPWHDAP